MTNSEWLFEVLLTFKIVPKNVLVARDFQLDLLVETNRFKDLTDIFRILSSKLSKPINSTKELGHSN